MSRTSQHQEQTATTTTMFSITIESLRGIDLSRLDRGDVMGKTATVSFSGSIAKMQIGTSRLCNVSGYPVVESRPIVSATAAKVSWGAEFPHLTLHTTAATASPAAASADRYRHRPTTTSTTAGNRNSQAAYGGGGVRLERQSSRLSTWSHQTIPEILELRVRLGQSTLTGVCHLMIGKQKNNDDEDFVRPQTAIHELPVRSTDPALSQAFLRVRVNYVHDDDNDDTLPPDITGCSSSQSSSSIIDEPTLLSRLDLRTLVEHRSQYDYYDNDNVQRHVGPPVTGAAAAAARANCAVSGFSFRDFRRALWACQPMVMDDSSTIATHESWDM
jgi:hypothetical protein